MKLFLILALLSFFVVPAHAEDRPIPILKGLKQVENDPCSANDLKEFMQGSFVITGYKKGATVPAPEEIYVGTATAQLYECSLVVKRCVGGVTETGEMKKTVALADGIQMWEYETTTLSGETRKYSFQMASNPDNYPVLFGGSEEDFEFWRPDPDETAACP